MTQHQRGKESPTTDDDHSAKILSPLPLSNDGNLRNVSLILRMQQSKNAYYISENTIHYRYQSVTIKIMKVFNCFCTRRHTFQFVMATQMVENID